MSKKSYYEQVFKNFIDFTNPEHFNVDPNADGAVVISFKNLIPDSSDSNKDKFLMNDFNVQYGSAVYNFDTDVTKKLAIFLVIKHDTSISGEAFVPRIEIYFPTHYGWRTLFGI